MVRVSALCLLLGALAQTATCVSLSPGMALTPAVRRQQPMPALVLPPDSIAEIVLVEGGVNFLSLYSGILGFRILLSWFPQAQSVAVLQPVRERKAELLSTRHLPPQRASADCARWPCVWQVFAAADVYLNLFRGVVPPIGGIDISPIGAFFTLNLLTQGVASLGATPGVSIKYVQRPMPGSEWLKARKEDVFARLKAA